MSLTNDPTMDGCLELELREAESLIATLTASRNAWRKLAELFAEHWTVNLLGCHCIHCHKEQVWNMAGNTWKQTHSPNCPIEQLRKMKEGDNVHL